MEENKKKAYLTINYQAFLDIKIVVNSVKKTSTKYFESLMFFTILPCSSLKILKVLTKMSFGAK